MEGARLEADPRLYRDDPERLAETAELATAKATLEEVFHPESETEVFDDPGRDRGRARRRRAGARSRSTPGWAGSPTSSIGELADELDQDAGALPRPAPRGAGDAQLPRRTWSCSSRTSRRRCWSRSAVRDRDYQELLVGVNPEATREYSLHTTGWSFDIRRDYASRRQAEAFQHALDRLSALALIDYAVEPGAIHVTVSELGDELLEPGARR